MQQEFDLKKFVPEEKTRKIFSKVFDKQTIDTVHRLAVKGYFDSLEFAISTGKEAYVFRARDKSGNFLAVKIFKIATSDFKRMNTYLLGDIRFKEIKRDKRQIVFAWCKKEFKNLLLMNQVKARVPLPIAFLKNVLVMEFIGEKGIAAPTLKEKPVKDIKLLRETIVDYLAKLVYKAKLVHSDLSEYNILNKNDEIVLIDCGQAVLTSHSQAKHFFERDIRNMALYFNKNGLKTSFQDLYNKIKSKKALFTKQKLF